MANRAGAILYRRKQLIELPRSKLRGIKPPLAYSHGPASLAGVDALVACECPTCPVSAA
jgi:hypothetical protein